MKRSYDLVKFVLHKFIIEIVDFVGLKNLKSYLHYLLRNFIFLL